MCLGLINTLLQIYPSHVNYVNTTHNTSINLNPPPLPHKIKNNYGHSRVLALEISKSVLQKSREKKKDGKKPYVVMPKNGLHKFMKIK